MRQFLPLTLVTVRVTEDDTGEGSTTTWVVDNLLYETTDVSISLSEIEVSELSRSDPVMLMGCTAVKQEISASCCFVRFDCLFRSGCSSFVAGLCHSGIVVASWARLSKSLLFVLYLRC
jgi:hypothetical protein